MDKFKLAFCPECTAVCPLAESDVCVKCNHWVDRNNVMVGEFGRADAETLVERAGFTVEACFEPWRKP